MPLSTAGGRPLALLACLSCAPAAPYSTSIESEPHAARLQSGELDACTAPTRSGGHFHAGFGRADLTLPPGPGLAGYGPDGRISRGYRRRIHARAMVLEDAQGERVAFAVVDLLYAPLALHRAVAERVERCADSGLTVDRIVISATHTHSAPGHFSAHRAYDEWAASVAGYDPEILAFFADQTAAAILTALRTLRPARAAWGSVPVWRVTRLRSFEIHQRDPHDHTSDYTPPAHLSPDEQHVDPTLHLLRVDTVVGGHPVPAGAFSIFAIHGIGNPSWNDLIDPDVHGTPQHELEWHIDSLTGLRSRRFRLQAAHVMANGALGDVVPERSAMKECAPPVLRPGLRPGWYQSPPAFEEWRPATGGDPEICLRRARSETETAGRKIADAAIALYDALADSLSNEIRIARAFESRRLDSRTSREGALEGLCPFAKTGTATVAGPELGESRLRGWRLFGLLDMGFDWGMPALKSNDDCHSPKRTLPPLAVRLFGGDHPFEEFAQLAVVRIGPMLIGTVPFEPTRTVGARMRTAMRAAIPPDDPRSPSQIAIISLANGYLQYVATDNEYRQQHYEGASTIYGPRSAEVFTGRLVELTRSLIGHGWESPPAVKSEVETYPGAAKAIMPRRPVTLPPVSRRIERFHCAGDSLLSRWTDLPPGALFPADQQVLAIERLRGSTWHEIAWDDHPSIEVRALRPRRSAYVWEARVRPIPDEGTLRFVLVERSLSGLRRIEGPSFEYDAAVGCRTSR